MPNQKSVNSFSIHLWSFFLHLDSYWIGWLVSAHTTHLQNVHTASYYNRDAKWYNTRRFFLSFYYSSFIECSYWIHICLFHTHQRSIFYYICFHRSLNFFRQQYYYVKNLLDSLNQHTVYSIYIQNVDSCINIFWSWKFSVLLQITITNPILSLLKWHSLCNCFKEKKNGFLSNFKCVVCTSTYT